MVSSPLPPVGTRLIHGDHIGTIKFVGPVHKSQGEWLGIEWDDPQRGKHDGVKEDKRYFSCIVPNSGSFLRATAAGLTYGTSFLKALTSKYVEALHASQETEKVILGSSNGTIEVEAVNMDKIRMKLSNLAALREVSLDDRGVASADAPGAIRQTCPVIRGLDLSQSLLPSWDVVAMITSELDNLERLALNQNRLSLPTSDSENLMRSAFSALKELQLNKTLTTWYECRVVTSYMPSLEVLEFGYNRLQSLTIDENQEKALGIQVKDNSTLKTLNFDSNRLSSWPDICQAMASMTALERLVVTSNQVGRIDPYPSSADGPSPIHDLKHLALSFNELKDWSDVDHIPGWCPKLLSLKIIGTPLSEDKANRSLARELIISKIASLEVLDAAPITSQERADSERFYLSWVVKNEREDNEETRLKKHPRWQDLCAIHGTPDEPPPQSQSKQDTLENKLFQITIFPISQPPPMSKSLIPGSSRSHTLDSILPYLLFDSSPPLPSALTTETREGGGEADAEVGEEEMKPGAMAMKVLPTMPVRTFRLKLVKTLRSKSKTSLSQTKQPNAPPSSVAPHTVRIWLVMHNNTLAEIKSERGVDGEETSGSGGVGIAGGPLDDLQWYGIEDGSEIVVYVPGLVGVK